MKIELTEQQYRYLLDLVYIGNWVLNSTREDDRIKEYDKVESLIFSHCLRHRMGKLVELYQGELIPSRAFANGGIHEAIESYEDVVFYEILAEELALRVLKSPGLPFPPVPGPQERGFYLLSVFQVQTKPHGCQRSQFESRAGSLWEPVTTSHMRRNVPAWGVGSSRVPKTKQLPRQLDPGLLRSQQGWHPDTVSGLQSPDRG